MQLVLAWPVRLIAVSLLVFSLVVDGAGYIYRVVNHYPLTDGRNVPLPPNLLGFTLYFHKGLDLSGGTHMVLQVTDVPPGRSISQVRDSAIPVIARRVNSLGVSEPLVEPEGNDRIIVELAGVTASKAQEVIGRTAKLVFTKWVRDAKAPASSPEPGYKPQLTGLTGDMVTGATAQTDPTTGVWEVNLTFNSDGASLFGKLTTDAVNACPGTNNDCPARHIPAWLDLTQRDIDNWAKQAGNVSQPPTVPGGKLLSNPTIIQPITGGNAVITGNFTADSAKALATDLSSGALPATIVVLQSTDVGASLGQSSVRQSIAAGLLGLAIVVIFMIAYYRIPGLLASLALLGYAAIVLALYRVIPVTLTLAGLAGFILSVGMAVDANVLIFERFKEEMRAGRTISAAVEAAVRRAWPAIRDSNTSTFITCVVLAVFAPGGSPVIGFAVTLGLGVAVSLISAIVVTHNLLAIVLNFGGLRRPELLGVESARAA